MGKDDVEVKGIRNLDVDDMMYKAIKRDISTQCVCVEGVDAKLKGDEGLTETLERSRKYLNNTYRTISVLSCPDEQVVQPWVVYVRNGLVQSQQADPHIVFQPIDETEPFVEPDEKDYFYFREEE